MVLETEPQALRPSHATPEPQYVPYELMFEGENAGDFNFGDPADAWGAEPNTLMVDTKVYVKKKEVPIGKLKTLSGESMDLTSDIEFTALRLIYKREDLGMENVVVYILTQDAPFGWDQAPLEEVEQNWSNDIEYPAGSMSVALKNPRSRKLAVNMDDLVVARGGDPTRRVPKTEQGGWGSTQERNRVKKKSEQAAS